MINYKRINFLANKVGLLTKNFFLENSFIFAKL